MVDLIPDVLTTLIILAFSMGFLLGEGGSKFDQTIKYGSCKAIYDSLGPVWRSLVDYTLNVTHHYEFGLLSIYLGWMYLSGHQQVFAWYFGWGMIVSDFKDFENILIRLGLKKRDET